MASPKFEDTIRPAYTARCAGVPKKFGAWMCSLQCSSQYVKKPPVNPCVEKKLSSNFGERSHVFSSKYNRKSYARVHGKPKKKKTRKMDQKKSSSVMCVPCQKNINLLSQSCETNKCNNLREDENIDTLEQLIYCANADDTYPFTSVQKCKNKRLTFNKCPKYDKLNRSIVNHEDEMKSIVPEARIQFDKPDCRGKYGKEYGCCYREEGKFKNMDTSKLLNLQNDEQMKNIDSAPPKKHFCYKCRESKSIFSTVKDQDNFVYNADEVDSSDDENYPNEIYFCNLPQSKATFNNNQLCYKCEIQETIRKPKESPRISDYCKNFKSKIVRNTTKNYLSSYNFPKNATRMKKNTGKNNLECPRVCKNDGDEEKYDTTQDLACDSDEEEKYNEYEPFRCPKILADFQEKFKFEKTKNQYKTFPNVDRAKNSDYDNCACEEMCVNLEHFVAGNDTNCNRGAIQNNNTALERYTCPNKSTDMTYKSLTGGYGSQTQNKNYQSFKDNKSKTGGCCFCSNTSNEKNQTIYELDNKQRVEHIKQYACKCTVCKREIINQLSDQNDDNRWRQILDDEGNISSTSESGICKCQNLINTNYYERQSKNLPLASKTSQMENMEYELQQIPNPYKKDAVKKSESEIGYINYDSTNQDQQKQRNTRKSKQYSDQLPTEPVVGDDEENLEATPEGSTTSLTSEQNSYEPIQDNNTTPEYGTNEANDDEAPDCLCPNSRQQTIKQDMDDDENEDFLNTQSRRSVSSKKRSIYDPLDMQPDDNDNQDTTRKSVSSKKRSIYEPLDMQPDDNDNQDTTRKSVSSKKRSIYEPLDMQPDDEDNQSTTRKSVSSKKRSIYEPLDMQPDDDNQSTTRKSVSSKKRSIYEPLDMQPDDDNQSTTRKSVSSKKRSIYEPLDMQPDDDNQSTTRKSVSSKKRSIYEPLDMQPDDEDNQSTRKSVSSKKRSIYEPLDMQPDEDNQSTRKSVSSKKRSIYEPLDMQPDNKDNQSTTRKIVCTKKRSIYEPLEMQPDDNDNQSTTRKSVSSKKRSIYEPLDMQPDDKDNQRKSVSSKKRSVYEPLDIQPDDKDNQSTTRKSVSSKTLIISERLEESSLIRKRSIKDLPGKQWDDTTDFNENSSNYVDNQIDDISKPSSSRRSVTARKGSIFELLADPTMIRTGSTKDISNTQSEVADNQYASRRSVSSKKGNIYEPLEEKDVFNMPIVDTDKQNIPRISMSSKKGVAYLPLNDSSANRSSTRDNMNTPIDDTTTTRRSVSSKKRSIYEPLEDTSQIRKGSTKDFLNMQPDDTDKINTTRKSIGSKKGSVYEPSEDPDMTMKRNTQNYLGRTDRKSITNYKAIEEKETKPTCCSCSNDNQPSEEPSLMKRNSVKDPERIKKKSTTNYSESQNDSITKQTLLQRRVSYMDHQLKQLARQNEDDSNNQFDDVTSKKGSIYQPSEDPRRKSTTDPLIMNDSVGKDVLKSTDNQFDDQNEEFIQSQFDFFNEQRKASQRGDIHSEDPSTTRRKSTNDPLMMKRRSSKNYIEAQYDSISQQSMSKKNKYMENQFAEQKEQDLNTQFDYTDNQNASRRSVSSKKSNIYEPLEDPNTLRKSVTKGFTNTQSDDKDKQNVSRRSVSSKKSIIYEPLEDPSTLRKSITKGFTNTQSDAADKQNASRKSISSKKGSIYEPADPSMNRRSIARDPSTNRRSSTKDYMNTLIDSTSTSRRSTSSKKGNIYEPSEDPTNAHSVYCSCSDKNISKEAKRVSKYDAYENPIKSNQLRTSKTGKSPTRTSKAKNVNSNRSEQKTNISCILQKCKIKAKLKSTQQENERLKCTCQKNQKKKSKLCTKYPNNCKNNTRSSKRDTIPLMTLPSKYPDSSPFNETNRNPRKSSANRGVSKVSDIKKYCTDNTDKTFRTSAVGFGCPEENLRTDEVCDARKLQLQQLSSHINMNSQNASLTENTDDNDNDIGANVENTNSTCACKEQTEVKECCDYGKIKEKKDNLQTFFCTHACKDEIGDDDSTCRITEINLYERIFKNASNASKDNTKQSICECEDVSNRVSEPNVDKTDSTSSGEDETQTHKCCYCENLDLKKDLPRRASELNKNEPSQKPKTYDTNRISSSSNQTRNSQRPIEINTNIKDDTEPCECEDTDGEDVYESNVDKTASQSFGEDNTQTKDGKLIKKQEEIEAYRCDNICTENNENDDLPCRISEFNIYERLFKNPPNQNKTEKSDNYNQIRRYSQQPTKIDKNTKENTELPCECDDNKTQQPANFNSSKQTRKYSRQPPTKVKKSTKDNSDDLCECEDQSKSQKPKNYNSSKQIRRYSQPPKQAKKNTKDDNDDFCECDEQSKSQKPECYNSSNQIRKYSQPLKQAKKNTKDDNDDFCECEDQSKSQKPECYNSSNQMRRYSQPPTQVKKNTKDDTDDLCECEDPITTQKPENYSSNQIRRYSQSPAQAKKNTKEDTDDLCECEDPITTQKPENYSSNQIRRYSQSPKQAKKNTKEDTDDLFECEDQISTQKPENNSSNQIRRYSQLPKQAKKNIKGNSELCCTCEDQRKTQDAENYRANRMRKPSRQPTTQERKSIKDNSELPDPANKSNVDANDPICPCRDEIQTKECCDYGNLKAEKDESKPFQCKSLCKRGDDNDECCISEFNIYERIFKNQSNQNKDPKPVCCDYGNIKALLNESPIMPLVCKDMCIDYEDSEADVELDKMYCRISECNVHKNLYKVNSEKCVCRDEVAKSDCCDYGSEKAKSNELTGNAPRRVSKPNSSKVTEDTDCCQCKSNEISDDTNRRVRKDDSSRRSTQPRDRRSLSPGDTGDCCYCENTKRSVPDNIVMNNLFGDTDNLDNETDSETIINATEIRELDDIFKDNLNIIESELKNSLVAGDAEEQNIIICPKDKSQDLFCTCKETQSKTIPPIRQSNMEIQTTNKNRSSYFSKIKERNDLEDTDA